jgi:hypothetical protein
MDEAFKKIAAALKELSSPDEAIFILGRTSNEAGFYIQTFVREFGTTIYPTAATCATKAAAIH